MFVAIFGRPGCAFCLRAVQLAKSLENRKAIKGYRYTDIQTEGISKEDLARTIGKPVHTVPQIFVDDTHVGGFTEFDRYVRDNDMISATA